MFPDNHPHGKVLPACLCKTCDDNRAASGLPEDMVFRTKGQLAIDILAEAFADGRAAGLRVRR
jgi:hypothetical protein